MLHFSPTRGGYMVTSGLPTIRPEPDRDLQLFLGKLLSGDSHGTTDRENIAHRGRGRRYGRFGVLRWAAPSPDARSRRHMGRELHGDGAIPAPVCRTDSVVSWVS